MADRAAPPTRIRSPRVATLATVAVSALLAGLVAATAAAALTPTRAVADVGRAAVVAPGERRAGTPSPDRAGAIRPGIGRQVGEPGPELPVNPGIDPDRARDDAEEVLRGDEYQAPEPGGRTIGDRLREWFADRFPSVDGGPSLDPLAWVVVGTVGLAALALVVWLLAGAARRRRPPDDEDDLDTSIEVEPIRTADEWEAEVARCLAAGDHRGAVRARFRVLASTLAERRLVADTPGRTVGEMRLDLSDGAPSATAPFAGAADLFEEVWYGDRTAGRADVDRVADLAAATLAAAPRRGSLGDASPGDRGTSATVTASDDAAGSADRGAPTPLDPDDDPSATTHHPDGTGP